MRIFASARVAVLDNDPERRAALCKALSELGMLQLLPVSSAEEARMLAKGAPVDLCIVDSAGITPDEIVMKNDIPPNPFDSARTPAILIAANPGRQTVQAAASSGYRLVMPAPVVPRVLYRRIGSILQKVRRAGRIGSPELTPAPIVHSTGLRPD